MSHFCKKRKIFLSFFVRPPSKVTNIDTSPMPPPPFENFSLNTLNIEEEPSVKKPVDRAGQKPIDGRSTGRSTGDEFEIYRSGRVEKILTGSIPVPGPPGCQCYC